MFRVSQYFWTKANNSTLGHAVVRRHSYGRVNSSNLGDLFAPCDREDRKNSWQLVARRALWLFPAGDKTQTVAINTAKQCVVP